MILFSSHGAAAIRCPADGRTNFQGADAVDEKALESLAQLGFVRRTGSGWRWSGEHPADDRALLALLARFDLHLEVGLAADETTWIAAAIRERPSEEMRDAFSGTGFRPGDAVRACLGEFAEIQSWLYRPGDSGKRCDRRALGKSAIDPWDILGFALEQRDRRPEFNRAWRGYDAIPDPTAFEGEIDWSPVEFLADGSTHWLPSQICFGRYAPDDWRSDSNGCAAGGTGDHAMARALLELVERDATGIWWYGQSPRPAVPHSLLEADLLAEALARRTRSGQRVRLLDLTHDLEIPVVAAILADDRGQLLGLGFGCAIDKVQAARSAYREMCQLELSIAFARQRAARDGAATRMEDRRLLDWLRDAAHLPNLQSNDETISVRPTANASDDAESVALILTRLRRAGLEAFSLQLHRTDIGIPAVRAFVPGLCHYKPRLGQRRLVEVPKKLGWKPESLSVADLNSNPLLI